MHCTIESGDANPFSIRDASDYYQLLPADLRRDVDSLWQDTRLSPRDRLILIARLARYDAKIVGIVQVLIPLELPAESDRLAVLAELAKLGFIDSPPDSRTPTLKAKAGHESGGTAPVPALPPPPIDPDSEPLYELIDDELNVTGDQLQPGPGAFRCDPELDRLVLLTNQEKHLRTWLIGRAYTQSGWLSREQLRRALAREGIEHTRRYFNYALAEGRGVWWDIDDTTSRVYLRGSVAMTERLIRMAVDRGHVWASCATNIPGTADVYINVAASIKQFRANCYAAWLSYRESVTIARDTQAALFNRKRDTFHAWESQLQSEDIQLEVTQNKAQVLINGSDLALWLEYEQHIPRADPVNDPITAFTAQRGYTWQGDRLDWWQLPNTYTCYGVIHHAHRGKAYKRRRRAKETIQELQPGLTWFADDCNPSANYDADLVSASAGLPVILGYFDSEDQLRRYAKGRAKSRPRTKPGRESDAIEFGFVRVGTNWKGHCIWELTDSKLGQRTTPNSMARADVFRRHVSDALARSRSYAAG